MASDFTPQFETLIDIYRSSLERFPDRPLFGTKRDGAWTWMTYREFGRLADQMRGGLARLGVQRGQRVGIISDNRWEWAVAAYGAYGLGAAVVPMYESQTEADWRYILADSGSCVLFVPDDEVRAKVAAMRADLPDLAHLVVIEGDAGEGGHRFADVLALGAEHPASLVEVELKDLAGFVYTSGTTGRPKGVLLSHENLASNVSAVHEIFPLEPDDRSLSFLPWAHSFGQTVELHTLFSMGCSTGFAESREKIVENLAEVRPTMLVSVPAVFNRIYDGLHKRMDEEGGLRKKLFYAAVANATRRLRAAGGRAGPWVEFRHGMYDRVVFAKVRKAFGGRLRYAISGGAAMSVEVGEFIDALGIPVYEGYGLSETSPIVSANHPGVRRLGSVGKPIPGVRVELEPVDTEDRSSGEIVVYGHCVMQGYHGLPEENARVFTPSGGFRTGDIGRFDEDGFLYITGRVKEQYKLENGKYVVPTPIEEHLKLSPFIVNAMVYGHNRPFNVALIVPDLEALRQWADHEGIAAEGEALLRDERARAKISDEIAAHSAAVKGYERIRDFVLLGEDFTPENGLLTPTLKVKRRDVLDRYGGDIAALYG